MTVFAVVGCWIDVFEEERRSKATLENINDRNGKKDRMRPFAIKRKEYIEILNINANINAIIKSEMVRIRMKIEKTLMDFPLNILEKVMIPNIRMGRPVRRNVIKLPAYLAKRR